MAIRFLCALVVVSFVVCRAATVSAADIWVGTWKLNVQASTSIPGPLLRSQTTRIEAIEGGIKLTADGVDGNGQAIHTEYSAVADGQDVPYKGGIAADTVALSRIDDHTFVVVYKMRGKVVFESRNTFTPDGKTRTVTQTGADAQGRAINNRMVYERQY
jgi:hypothetical protein